MKRSRILMLAGYFGLLLVLSACGNTVEGAGRDIEDMGEWVQDTF